MWFSLAVLEPRSSSNLNEEGSSGPRTAQRTARGEPLQLALDIDHALRRSGEGVVRLDQGKW